MKFIWTFFIFWFFISFTGCSFHASAETDASCPSGQWCYDSLVLADLTPAMLNTDFSPICASHEYDKQTLWKAFNQSIAWAESAWNPNSVLQEDFIDAVTHKLALSVGLFQLSVGDILNYKNSPCSLLTETNIADITINVNCAVGGIQAKLLKNNTDLLGSLGAYWSTLRPLIKGKPNAGYKRFINKFYILLPACQQ